MTIFAAAFDCVAVVRLPFPRPNIAWGGAPRHAALHTHTERVVHPCPSHDAFISTSVDSACRPVQQYRMGSSHSCDGQECTTRSTAWSFQRIRKTPPWRVLFFGSDTFAVSSLNALNLNRLESEKPVVDTLDVVAISKETPLRKFAAQANLFTYDWPNPVNHNMYDVGVVVSFGHLIPSEIIHMFPYGILNVHPSLLPRWRGASPIAHTVLNGDEMTGVSITDIRPKHFDIGPVILRDVCSVPPKMTTKQLTEKLSRMGSNLLLKALSNLPQLEKMEVEQDMSGVTYAHKVTHEMARVDWAGQTCLEIDRQYRAISDMYNLSSQYKDHTIKLSDMVQIEDTNSPVLASFLEAQFKLPYIPAGTPFYHKKRKIICIKCKDGWVGFHGINVKKSMTALEFYNGYLSKEENRNEIFHSLDNSLNKYILRTKV